MLRQQFFQFVAQTSPSPIDIEVSFAEGIYVHGPHGEKWIDFISGICVSNLGHGVKEIKDAIHQQTEQYLHPMVYGEAVMSPQVSYAARLVEVLDSQLECVYFGNSGAEAIEGALKIAKKYTGRQQLVSFHQAYHGSTHGALSVTGNPAKKQGYGPLLPDVYFLHFNQLSELQKITKDTAAVIIEPIQGAAGVVLAESGYLQAVKARCEETGALLIMDEIQTGLGRTGKLFAHQLYGVVPDILVLAKALGGGLPLSAFISSRKIMSVIQTNPVLGHLTTYGGHPLCCAAGLALLDTLIASNILDHIPIVEKILQEKLQHPAILELRGVGLMYAVIFKDYAFAEAVRIEALKQGLITIGFLSIDNGLRICPPLTITVEEMEAACDCLLSAIEATSGSVWV